MDFPEQMTIGEMQVCDLSAMISCLKSVHGFRPVQPPPCSHAVGGAPGRGRFFSGGGRRTLPRLLDFGFC